LRYSSLRFYGGEGLQGYRELAIAQTHLEGLAYVSRTLREPLTRAIPAQRFYKDSSRLRNQASRIPKHAEVFAATPQ
jgi:hypothetical protein